MGRTSIYLAHENKHYVVTVKDFREKTLFIEDFDRKISQDLMFQICRITSSLLLRLATDNYPLNLNYLLPLPNN